MLQVFDFPWMMFIIVVLVLLYLSTAKHLQRISWSYSKSYGTVAVFLPYKYNSAASSTVFKTLDMCIIIVSCTNIRIIGDLYRFSLSRK